MRLRIVVFHTENQHCMRTYLNEELVAEVRDNLLRIKDGMFGVSDEGFLLLPFSKPKDVHPPCWIKSLHFYGKSVNIDNQEALKGMITEQWKVWPPTLLLLLFGVQFVKRLTK